MGTSVCQVRRRRGGLFANERILLFGAKILNNTRANNWSSVNQSLGYVKWILLQRTDLGEVDHIGYLVKLSKLHPLGVTGDDIEEQARHYREAAELNLVALEFSKTLWGVQDLRRLDLYYGLIKQFYLQSVAVFHFTVDQALRATREQEQEGETNAGASTDSYLLVQEWIDLIPVVPFPYIAPTLGQVAVGEQYDALLHVRLNTLLKGSRWVKGTLKSHLGVVQEFDLLESAEGHDLDLEQLERRLHSVVFVSVWKPMLCVHSRAS